MASSTEGPCHWVRWGEVGADGWLRGWPAWEPPMDGAVGLSSYRSSSLSLPLLSRVPCRSESGQQGFEGGWRLGGSFHAAVHV